MADKYYRLVCFVVNICPEPLREFFIKLAKNELGSSYTTLDSYLAHKRRDVMQLVIKRKIRDDQFDLLYPGHGTADEKQWDVTLLVTLITEMFTSILQPVDIFFMKNEIRGIRNELQHLPNTSNMSDDDFNNYWGRLDTASTTIAKQVFSTAKVESFRNKIKNAKCDNLPHLGDSLRIWYEEIIKQMANKLNHVESDTRETTSILRQVTAHKPGPSGNNNKRIKTTDVILTKLQVSFETTMREIPEVFIAPVEVADIKTKLRDNHHVIVTGSNNSRYSETALAAIKGLDYNPKRCVEMQYSSDWRHIDPEYVDLVLCRNPFGSVSYDENKSRCMADIFNSMMHTAKGDDGINIDIVMIVDYEILRKCKQYHEHDILEEVVKVFDATSEAHPADLTLEVGSQNMKPDTNNLRVMSSKFLKRYSISSLQADNDFLKDARVKFKEYKAIVLTGPKKCGKTSVAVALTSSYHPSRFSLLTEPSDFKKIDLQNVCVVIIDEFAGKYSYEEKDVYKWYDMFDHIYDFVISGQMNVVVTCEQSKLDRCCNEISRHPLLDHRVNMPDRTIVIKQEMVHHNTGPTLDNVVGSIDTSTAVETRSVGISGTFNVPYRNDKLTATTLTWSQPSTQQGQITILNQSPMQTFTASSNIPSSYSRNFLPAPTLSTENGVLTDQISRIDEHQWMQRVPQTQTSNSSVRGLTGTRVWSVKDKVQRNIRVNSDRNECYITGSCLLPSGEILLADSYNLKLKKLDARYQVIGVCDLPDKPRDVCYIGNNVAVIAMVENTLQFVDISEGMTLIRSVDTDHYCSGLAYHDNQLYVIDRISVYIYSKDGVKQRVLYTGQSDLTFFHQIAISDDGSLIYLIDLYPRLITIDSSGKKLYTFNDSELTAPRGVCVDGDGHVLVSSFSTNKIYQISSYGKQKLGIIDGMDCTRTLCFDKDKTTLVAAGHSDNICVLKLQK